MVPHAKHHVGHRTPVTTPEIWLDGEYIGGADQLAEKLAQ
jgi:glutaredoxin-related protein